MGELVGTGGIGRNIGEGRGWGLVFFPEGLVSLPELEETVLSLLGSVVPEVETKTAPKSSVFKGLSRAEKRQQRLGGVTETHGLDRVGGFQSPRKNHAQRCPALGRS